jgi:hypothetical protein
MTASCELAVVERRGSRSMLAICESLAASQLRGREIRHALLMRESDFVLAAIQHGGLTKGWGYFWKQSVGWL